MPQRLALIAASVAATIVLTVGLVAAGFAPSSDSGQSVEIGSEGSIAATEVSPESPLEPEVVYVKPAPSPKTVVLQKQATPKRTASSGSGTKAVRQVRYERDDEDEYEGRKHAREKAAERAKERREHERDNDD